MAETTSLDRVIRDMPRIIEAVSDFDPESQVTAFRTIIAFTLGVEPFGERPTRAELEAVKAALPESPAILERALSSADSAAGPQSRSRDVATASLPETDLARIARWCQGLVPERARDQVRFEHQVRGRTVTIVERRVSWDAPGTEFGPAWTARPCAQLRHSTDGWRLYWADSKPRWHLVEDIPATADLQPLLDAIADPRRAFLG